MFKLPKRANLALQSYLKSNHSIKSLSLFRELLRKNTSSIDSFSFLYAIKICTKNFLPIEGKQLHGLVLKLGFEPIIFLQSSLIEFYSMAGELGDAHKVFDEIPEKNVVCWTALMSGCVNNRKSDWGLEMFRRMQTCRIEPDRVTLTVALSACADLGALDVGEWIHQYIRREKKVNIDLSLNNALINMYAKCGDIEAARRLFDSTRKKDVTTWTSMIVGLALNGRASEALSLFEDMREESKNVRVMKRSGLMSPNDVTFIGVLMACSHAGLVEEGKRHFQSMTEEYGLKPRLSHYGCMVDLLCRCGLLKEAYDLILSMPVRPNAVMWRTLLGSCGITGDVHFASKAHARLMDLEANRASDDVIMSNVYAGKCMWDEKIGVRDRMKQRRAPGCSSIGIGGQISAFAVQ